MRLTVLFVLFLLTLSIVGAVQQSALEGGDFELSAPFDLYLESAPRNIPVVITLDTRKQVPAFNVTIKLTNPLIGVNIVGENNQTVNVGIGESAHKTINWQVSASEPGTYDFSNAFEIISWDDSVALELEEIPKQAFGRKLAITGTTDNTDLCAEHEYHGIYAEKENCNAMLLVNGEELGYAEDDGTFSFEHELEKGENQLEIVAQDPGGNTDTQNFTVTFIPTPLTEIEENVGLATAALGLAVLVVLLLGFYLWKKNKMVSKKVVSVEKEAERKIALEHEQIKREIDQGKHTEQEKAEEQRFQFLLKRKEELKKELADLKKKVAVMGLTADESHRLEMDQQEELRIGDELRANARYLRQLEEEANSIPTLLGQGQTSPEIMAKLREHYDNKDIAKIQEILKNKHK